MKRSVNKESEQFKCFIAAVNRFGTLVSGQDRAVDFATAVSEAIATISEFSPQLHNKAKENSIYTLTCILKTIAIPLLRFRFPSSEKDILNFVSEVLYSAAQVDNYSAEVPQLEDSENLLTVISELSASVANEGPSDIWVHPDYYYDRLKATEFLKPLHYAIYYLEQAIITE